MDVETSLPADTPTTPRSKRTTWVWVGLVAVLALYFAPQLPAVRAWLLERVEGAARSAGYRLDYAAAAGNPWWNLQLREAEVSGPGLDLQVDKLRLEYLLPSLVTGRLPVSVTAAGVRGAVTLTDLARPAGTGKTAVVRPVLRDLKLSDVSVDVRDAPYTLPDLSVTNLQARPAAGGFRAEATLTTSEGEAEVTGNLSLDPLRFSADIPRADARLARQWWRGVTGGTLVGTVAYADGRLRAAAALQDGSLAFLGETVTELRGDLVYQDATVSADLSGTALGGAVKATGAVDIPARRWSAEATGALELRDAALWLAAGRLPVDLSTVPLKGSVTTRLHASGWQTVALRGAAAGAGTVAGYPLEDLQVDYGFDNTRPDRGADVNATARLAGGDVTAALTPQADGFSFALTGAGVEVSQAVRTDLNVALERTDGGLSGGADVALTGTLLGEPLRATLNGSLDSGGLQARAVGTALGGPLTGGVSLQDGRLTGTLNLPEARLPVTKRPVGLSLSADGPPSALPLTFTLTTPEPTGIVLGPLVVPKDVGGQVTATLRGAQLEAVQGRLGTLNLAGNLGLNGQNGALTYRLNPTPLSGVVTGEASLANGVLTLENGVLTGAAALTSSELRASGVTLPPLVAAPLRFAHDGTWTAALATPDQSLALRYDGDKVRATTAGYPVTAFGQRLALSGTSTLTASDPLGSLAVRLKSATPFGDATLTGGADALRFDLETSRFGPDSRLVGTANLRDQTLDLSGQLGALGVSGEGRLGGAGVTGTLNVAGGGETLTLRASGDPTQPDPTQQDVVLTGRLSLPLVGDLFNVTASGTLDANLQRRGGRYEGGADLTGDLAGVPVDVRVSGEGDGLGVTGRATPLSGTPFSVPVELGGRLRPSLELSASSDLGGLTLDEAGRLTGAGTVPGSSLAGFEVAPQPWRVAGNLADGTLRLELPDTASSLSATRGADGWRAVLNLDQALTRGDSTLRVTATGDLGSVLGDTSGAAGSTLNGAVTVRTPAGDAALPFTGSPAGLELQGDLPADVAASLFGAPAGLSGDLSLAARARFADGLTYSADTVWHTPETTLTARLEGSGTSLTLDAMGDGLDLRYTPTSFRLDADGFRLEPFLTAENIRGGVSGGVSGTLSRTPETGWDGALTLETTAPGALRGVLTGAGDGLELRADYAADGLSLGVSGALAPTPDLTLSGAFRKVATVRGRVGGTLREPDLTATLTTRALMFGLDLPAQSLDLSAGLADGLRARLRGDALDLTLVGGRLQGRLELPFTVAGAAEVLRADVGGTIKRPSLQGSLAGSVASGPVVVADNRLTTTVRLDPAPLLSGLPLTDSALTVRFEATPDLAWRAQLDGAAQVRGLPVALGGTVAGQGARYQGDVTATLNGAGVPLTVSGAGSTARASATFAAFDLSSLAPALPFDLTGTLGGAATLDGSAPQLFTFDLTGVGTAQNRPFDLTARLAAGTGLNVGGEVDGVPVTLLEDASAYTLNLGAPDQPLNLTGRLELVPALRVKLDGEYQGQAVRVRGSYAPEDAPTPDTSPLNTATWSTATWSAAVGDATLTGSALQTDGVWTVRSRLDSPPGSPPPLTGQAEVAARVGGGNVTLDTLTATTTLAGRALALELSGSAWPAPDLAGTLEVGGLEPSTLSFTGEASGYRAGLTYGGLNGGGLNGGGLDGDSLNLSAGFNAGFALQTLALQGTGTLPVGPGLDLSTGLAWTAAEGFSGKAVAEATAGDFNVTLTAVGTGPLGVAGRAVYAKNGPGQDEQGQEVARLELSLSQNPFKQPDLNGRLVLQGDAGEWVPSYRRLSAAPTRLEGDLKISGTATNPRLGGPVSLGGALQAAGTFVWEAQDETGRAGLGRLELAGEGLEVAGALDTAGWTVSARAAALALGDLLPQLDTPRLDATLDGGGAWGEPPALHLGALELRTPNGALRGHLDYDGALAGRLETDFALADLRLGPALQGRVAGDVVVGSSGGERGPTLTGTLQATSLGLAGQPATLDGDLVVRGLASTPDLGLNLRGTGTASGTLSARLAPSSYAVTSTLNVGELASDFAVTFGGNAFVASGDLVYQDYALSVGGAADVLSLTGRERLAGWQLGLVPAAARLELRGPLAGLSDALAGEVALTAAWPPGGEPSLGGTFGDVAVGPVAVGDVAVTSSGPVLALTGDSLDAKVTLQNGVPWTLARFAVALPGETALELAGRGTLKNADLTGRLAGRLRGEPFEVPAALTYSGGNVTVTSDAALLGGRLVLDARGSAAAGWQGAVAVDGVSASGVTVDLAGDLSGPLPTPELTAALGVTATASPATAFGGELTVSPLTQTLTGDLTSPLLDETVSVAGALTPAPALTLQTDAGGTVELDTADGLLTAAGRLELGVGPVALTLTGRPAAADSANGAGDKTALTLNVSVPRVPGLALTTALPHTAPAALPAFVTKGLVFRGDRDTDGSVVVNVGEPSAELRALSLQTPEGSLELSGRLAPGSSGLTGRWRGDAGGTATLPWLAALTDFGLSLDVSGDTVSVSADGDGSHLDARYDLGRGVGSLDAALDAPAGSARAALTYDAARGPSGSLTLTNFPAFTGPAAGDARLDAALSVTPAAVTGTADLELGEGSLKVQGDLGLASLLPTRFAPEGGTAQNLSARFETFAVENVPWVARALPYASAPVTGAAALRDGAVTGALSAPVVVAARTLPLRLDLGGTLEALEVQGELERSSFTLTRAGDTVAGLVRFVDFPLDKAVAAVAGPSAVSAQLTGALRFEVPGGVLEKSYIRFSSERFVLEEGGVVTTGDLSFDLENGALSVQKAVFEGVGRWQASGVASRNRLSLRFDASDADFGPLLRLVPPLAGLNVGAFGSVQLVTGGSLLNPVVRAGSSELELRLGGSAYRLSDTSVTVQDKDFVTSGRLDGVAPLTGSLVFGGGGQVKLAAPRSFDLALRFSGDPEVPVLGTLEGVSGVVSVQPGEPWRLAATGALGNPFKLAGTLSPLDLRLTGQGLNLRAPQFFLASSLTDTDLRFFRADGYHLAGSLLTRQAQLDLESRQEAAQPTPPQSATTEPEDSAAEDSVSEASAESSGEAAPVADGPRARSPFLARLTFDDLSLTAPQQVGFSENFGSGELGNVDLVLSGTAAQPRLSGRAEGVRGTVRFAGRDFALQRALAEFEPAQGLYPTLDIAATTRFDKQQVLAGLADEVSFVEPQSGNDFGVTLGLTGGVVANPAGPKPFKVDVTPRLSSDAVIEVGGAPNGDTAGAVGASGTRPLSEPELFSLLTLGKLELSPEFAQGGLATSLAQGALDTAVDFLILSELQRGLGDALGLDLLEIRTTPLGSLLTGDNADFGVSLRLGGYLSDEVFASFEVGSLGLGADVSLRNAFDVRYSLGALEFSLAGKLDFYRNAGLEPLPEVDLNLGYAFSPLVRLETGIELSTAKQGVRFGVSLRW